MTTLRRAIRATAAAVTALALASAGLLAAATPAAAVAYVPLSGAGSTWSQNAIQEWASNVEQYGMRINYSGTGSTDGRNQFASGLVDFGVSEIPYGKDDGAATEARPPFKFAYMPIVAGGTAFMYNLSVGKNKVTNLRLSGDTIAKIFTNVITMWNDPAIKADNPGLALPARKVVPVVRSDGSGTTAQFTTWMMNQYPDLWNAYCAKAGRKTPCGITSVYPLLPGSATTAQSGSQNVAGYVAQSSSVGAITYVEYSYALNAHFPVVKVRNTANYYIEPTAQSVAVALQAAKINTDHNSPDYLTQDLRGVYRYSDPRTYPLSSYSYMLIPVELTAKFSTSKGVTLSSFANYFLCEGQQQAPALGYSPLPKNLVEAGFTQVARIPGAVEQHKDFSKCHNPTLSPDGSNALAKTAPYPSACDKAGVTQCTGGTGGAKAPTPTTGGKSSTTGGTAATPNRNGTPSAGAATTGGTSAGGAVQIDPDTGQPVGGSAGGEADTAAAIPVSLGTQIDPALKTVLVVVAGGLLVGLVVIPPLVARLVGKRGGR